MELLSSNVIQIHCEPTAVCQTGQTDGGFRGRKKDGTSKELLPLNSYSFGFLRVTNYEKMIHESLQVIHEIDNLHYKEKQKLKRAIADRLVKLSDSYPHEVTKQLKLDLKWNVPNIKSSLVYKLQERCQKKISTDDFDIRIDPINDDDFHVESNISKVFGFSIQETHEIVGNALLAIGRLNARIAIMKEFSALTGFKQDEVRIFEEKLSFLEDQFSAEHKENTLKRILSWPNFPDLNQALREGKLNIEKLLKIRERPECKEFRQWLWSANELAEQELQERMQSMTSKLSSWVYSNSGENWRWATTTGIGSLLPVIGGIAVSSLDKFLLEKLLPKSGIITFLGNMYSSIFESKKS